MYAHTSSTITTNYKHKKLNLRIQHSPTRPLFVSDDQTLTRAPLRTQQMMIVVRKYIPTNSISRLTRQNQSRLINDKGIMANTATRKQQPMEQKVQQYPLETSPERKNILIFKTIIRLLSRDRFAQYITTFFSQDISILEYITLSFSLTVPFKLNKKPNVNYVSLRSFKPYNLKPIYKKSENIRGPGRR